MNVAETFIKITGSTSRNSDVGISPCEKYNCHHYDKCKFERLACHAFHLYAVTGKTIKPGHPTHQRYLRLFKED